MLLASAAVIALAFAAPMAGAQYTDPAQTAPPYQAQMPEEEPSGPVNEPMAPQTQQTPPPVESEPSAQAPAGTAQADPYAQPGQAEQPQTYAQSPTEPQSATARTIPVDLAETATEAGMDGVPMTAADVCAPRSVALAERTSRLNVSTRRHLINAADHASVCEMRRIVIESPDGRADAVRQTLIDHGVEESLIEVQEADDGALGVEMTFAGVATSSAQYAALFNPVQTAAYTPPAGEAQPYAQPGAPMPAEPAEPMAEPPAASPPPAETTEEPAPEMSEPGY
jgi:outer membrane protein OmpA-like peptidoglycan-associated protein